LNQGRSATSKTPPVWILHHARFLARVLDGAGGPLNVPVLGRRIGLDPLIGLLTPWGDTLFLFVGLYWLFLGWQARLPRTTMAGLMFNILMDWGIGLVPGIGDVSDFFWRAHWRNCQLLEAHFEAHCLDGVLFNNTDDNHEAEIITIQARAVS